MVNSSKRWLFPTSVGRTLTYISVVVLHHQYYCLHHQQRFKFPFCTTKHCYTMKSHDINTQHTNHIDQLEDKSCLYKSVGGTTKYENPSENTDMHVCTCTWALINVICKTVLCYGTCSIEIHIIDYSTVSILSLYFHWLLCILYFKCTCTTQY